MITGVTEWLIIVAFYLPLHFLGPVGVVVLTIPVAGNRHRLIRYVLVECMVFMLAAFALVIWLAADNLQMAMLILFLSMLLPYFFILLHRMLLTHPRSRA